MNSSGMCCFVARVMSFLDSERERCAGLHMRLCSLSFNRIGALHAWTQHLNHARLHRPNVLVYNTREFVLRGGAPCAQCPVIEHDHSRKVDSSSLLQLTRLSSSSSSSAVPATLTHTFSASACAVISTIFFSSHPALPHEPPMSVAEAPPPPAETPWCVLSAPLLGRSWRSARRPHFSARRRPS